MVMVTGTCSRTRLLPQSGSGRKSNLRPSIRDSRVQRPNHYTARPPKIFGHSGDDILTYVGARTTIANYHKTSTSVFCINLDLLPVSRLLYNADALTPCRLHMKYRNENFRERKTKKCLKNKNVKNAFSSNVQNVSNVQDNYGSEAPSDDNYIPTMMKVDLNSVVSLFLPIRGLC